MFTILHARRIRWKLGVLGFFQEKDHITATANFTCQGGLALQIFMKYSGKCSLSHDRAHSISKRITEWIHCCCFFLPF